MASSTLKEKIKGLRFNKFSNLRIVYIYHLIRLHLIQSIENTHVSDTPGKRNNNNNEIRVSLPVYCHDYHFNGIGASSITVALLIHFTVFTLLHRFYFKIDFDK